MVGELRLIENLAEAAWKSLPEYKDEKKLPPSAAGAGLSERYAYDIGLLPSLELDDTYTIPFLPKVQISGARIVYRASQAKYGEGVHKLIVFENAQQFGLGATPLASADTEVVAITEAGVLPHGSARVPYAPIGGKCEIDLGVAPEVLAERRVMKKQRTNFEFDRFGQVEGYDEREWIQVRLRNLSEHSVTLEYTDTIPGVWDVAAEVPYIEEGLNDVTFHAQLSPHSEETLSYRLLKRQGRRVRLGPIRPK